MAQEVVTKTEVEDVVNSLHLGYKNLKNKRVVSDVTAIILINKGLYADKLAVRKNIRNQVDKILTEAAFQKIH
jgi:hypothetical protein